MAGSHRIENEDAAPEAADTVAILAENASLRDCCVRWLKRKIHGAQVDSETVASRVQLRS